MKRFTPVFSALLSEDFSKNDYMMRN